MTLRVLHIDDEPDICEVVKISLDLDPALEVHSSFTGADGLADAAAWSPDLILLDIMMPGMDGIATLERLRKNPKTTKIPVVFMTARARVHELEHFRSLGVAGVIAKPFDPMTLAVSVRSYLQASRFNELRDLFLARVKVDAAKLAERRVALAGADPRPALETIRETAHSLAGSAGIYGLHAMGQAAAELETAAIGRLAGSDGADVAAALDRLLACIDGGGESAAGREKAATG